MILQRETLKYNKEISNETEKTNKKDGSSKEENSTEINVSTGKKVAKLNHSLRLWNCSRLRKKMQFRSQVYK